MSGTIILKEADTCIQVVEKPFGILFLKKCQTIYYRVECGARIGMDKKKLEFKGKHAVAEKATKLLGEILPADITLVGKIKEYMSILH